MASRGGATRPNGPNTGNKICQFKLVLLGESAVGKSSLVLRFVKGQFHEFQESTIGGTFLLYSSLWLLLWIFQFKKQLLIWAFLKNIYLNVLNQQPNIHPQFGANSQYNISYNFQGFTFFFCANSVIDNVSQCCCCTICTQKRSILPTKLRNANWSLCLVLMSLNTSFASTRLEGLHYWYSLKNNLESWQMCDSMYILCFFCCFFLSVLKSLKMMH